MPAKPAASTISGNGTLRKAIAAKAERATTQPKREPSALPAIRTMACTTIASTAALRPSSRPPMAGMWPRKKKAAESATMTRKPGRTKSRPATSPPRTPFRSQPE
jgi:hypothetical protein